MAPVAAAAYVLVAALFVMAVAVGAFGGAGVWAVRGSVVWGGVLAAGGFLVATVLLGSYSLRAGGFGLPVVLLTFLISWLIARYAETRLGLRRPWATLVGLCCGLFSGFMSLSLFGLNFVALVSTAVAADVALMLLILFLHRSRTAVS